MALGGGELDDRGGSVGPLEFGLAGEDVGDRFLQPEGGKSLTQNGAVEQASGEILAFSDANSEWESGALTQLVAAFGDAEVGYACGQVSFTQADAAGDNQEGVYWRYEMAVRELESDLGGVTAGNGAIYAVRASDYIPLGPAGSHDLSFPFLLNKRGRRAVYVTAARATEAMVPTIEGEWARKRRMMIGIWDIAVGEGMIRPAGYSPLYAFQIYSHRLLRYLMEHPNQALSPSHLLQAVWEYPPNTGDPDLVRAHVRNLRAKIEKNADRKYIRTIHGVGYMISK